MPDVIRLRYRCEYLHVPTSSRIIFTVPVPVNEDRIGLGNSAYEAMAKRYAARWIEQTGIGVDCVPLSVVRVTKNNSVWVDGTHIVDTSMFSYKR